MKKKQKKIQIILISIGLLLILLTYFPFMNKTKLAKNQPTQKDLEEIPVDQSTSFKSVEYKGVHSNNPFTIKSEEAYILNEDPDIVYMKNMKVVIDLKDGRIVIITSDKGKYDKKTYDCFFEQNVKATDGETEIFSENLDLLAAANSVEIYNNVIINHPTANLLADKVNYDFETKYFKVSMFDEKVVKMKVVK